MASSESRGKPRKKKQKAASGVASPTSEPDDSMFDNTLTEDDIRRAHELIDKYGWDHLRKS